MSEGTRALYTKIQLPGRKRDQEDDQAYDERVMKAQNLIGQNFTYQQNLNAEMQDRLNSLEEWATQFRG